MIYEIFVIIMILLIITLIIILYVFVFIINDSTTVMYTSFEYNALPLHISTNLTFDVYCFGNMIGDAVNVNDDSKPLNVIINDIYPNYKFYIANCEQNSSVIVVLNTVNVKDSMLYLRQLNDTRYNYASILVSDNYTFIYVFTHDYTTSNEMYTNLNFFKNLLEYVLKYNNIIMFIKSTIDFDLLSNNFLSYDVHNYNNYYIVSKLMFKSQQIMDGKSTLYALIN